MTVDQEKELVLFVKKRRSEPFFSESCARYLTHFERLGSFSPSIRGVVVVLPRRSSSSSSVILRTEDLFLRRLSYLPGPPLRSFLTVVALRRTRRCLGV